MENFQQQKSQRQPQEQKELNLQQAGEKETELGR
jgi:hypothetical protein